MNDRRGSAKVPPWIGALFLSLVALFFSHCTAAPPVPDDRPTAKDCRLTLHMADVCYKNSRHLKDSCEKLRTDLEREMLRRKVDQPGFPRFCQTICTVAKKGVSREAIRETITRKFGCGPG